jgi:peptidoglycan/LPS O-acetylase OafA/YrhL
LRYLLLGILIAASLVWLGVKARRGRFALGAFGGVATLWTLIVGILGTVLLGLWAVTDHQAAYWNENLFLFNPLSLALAFTLPPALFGVPWCKPISRKLAVSVALLAFVGCVAQLLPFLDQVNGQLYALAVLPHIALAIGVYLTAGPDPESDESLETVGR